MTYQTAAFLLTLTAGAALAHSGVKDAQVLARMEQMKEIGRSVGILADMARGKAAFDAARAAEARVALKNHAAAIPEAFRTKATDPESEARPVIWSEWQDFTRQAAALEEAAAAIDTTSPETLRAGIMPVAQSCTGCHELYRLEEQ